MDIETIAKNAKDAFFKTINLSNEVKNLALYKIIQKLKSQKKEILDANYADLSDARILLESGEINKSTYDRLKLNDFKIKDLIAGLEDLIRIADPVNKEIFKKELDKGLILKKVSVPIGVIGVIFEARPDCYIQIASLLIKSGNCGILKGGIESKNTNEIMARIVSESLSEIPEFPQNVINM
ncbi:gamma-glutamyl-phosphate reductase, partial [bacterium]|nr:gamma-glutamyl-phosphate reductase [bacterium]